MSERKQLLICTHNRGKLKEIKAILEDLPVDLLTLDDIPDLPDPVEDGDTFLANALIKVRSAYAHAGLPCLGDDSGLVVPLLDGAPGIYSARYGGSQSEVREERDRVNRDKLRAEIAKKGSFPCDAYFQCTMVLCLGEGEEHAFEGRAHGQIIDEERGDGGFGYDPLFFIPEHEQTYAELSSETKNQLSHRGRALQALKAWLSEHPEVFS